MSPGPDPEKLRRSAGQWLDATLKALGVGPDGVDLLPGDVAGALPETPGHQRVSVGVTIRDLPPGVDAFAVAAEVWQRGLCRVAESRTAHGRTLTGQDPDGYLLTLTAGDRLDLVVESPPMAGKRDPGVASGVMIGLLIGPIASCLSFFGAVNSPVEPDSGLSNVLLAWAWVPVLLVIGGALVIKPSFRRFGTGLIIGAATIGILMSSICAPLIET